MKKTMFVFLVDLAIPDWGSEVSCSRTLPGEKNESYEMKLERRNPEPSRTLTPLIVTFYSEAKLPFKYLTRYFHI